MKRKVAFFIPVKKEQENYKVFLQLRSIDDSHLPGYVGLFGGEVNDGETQAGGMLREIEEELGYVPVNYNHLVDEISSYKNEEFEKSVYWEIVPSDFDDKIIIGEGDGGIWVDEQEVQKIDKIFPLDLRNIKKLFEILKQK